MGHKRIETKASSVDTVGMTDRGKSTLAMLTALEDEPNMNDWERDFVASVTDRFLIKEWSLTQPQFDTLEKIYRKWN